MNSCANAVFPHPAGPPSRTTWPSPSDDFLKRSCRTLDWRSRSNNRINSALLLTPFADCTAAVASLPLSFDEGEDPPAAVLGLGHTAQGDGAGEGAGLGLDLADGALGVGGVEAADSGPRVAPASPETGSPPMMYFSVWACRGSTVSAMVRAGIRVARNTRSRRISRNCRARCRTGRARRGRRSSGGGHRRRRG